MMEQPALFGPVSVTVAELTRYMRQLLESDEVLQDVWVMGEVSNLSRPGSGHVYFTLKDSQASLRCVIWRSTVARLRTDLQNGLAIEAHGSISIYEPSGQYQLYVTSVRPAGEGRLYQEFLRLKASLEEEGLFDEARKRPIPERPALIGIVTSPTGAALQDMLKTLRKRYPLAEVVLSPAPVQGVDAPPEIVIAIRNLNRYIHPDVILVARGGGSLEDLWAFNDERVVRAIAASQAPVITGVGHETDFTLSDFASDLRAPTPTGAAVLATPDKADMKAALVSLSGRLISAYQVIVSDLRDGMNEAGFRLQRSSPLWRIQNNRQRLDEVSTRIQRAFVHQVALRRADWRGMNQQLASLSPQAVLQRGYAIVRTPSGNVVRSVTQVQNGQEIRVDVTDGSFGARVEKEA